MLPLACSFCARFCILRLFDFALWLFCSVCMLLRVCFRRDLAFASEILLFGGDSICRAYIFCKHFLKFFVEFYGGYDFGVGKPRLDKV